MKQRQIVSFNNMNNCQYSDWEDNIVDSVPLLPVRNSYVPTERSSPSRRNVVSSYRHEQSHNINTHTVQRPVLEAQVQETDTLQAIALRFHCSVEELKRLNNIHRENEIFARSILKIPITPHTILLGSFPQVHQSSGNSSPKSTSVLNSHENLLLNPQELNDRLLVAQAPADTSSNNEAKNGNVITVNEVIFNSEVVPNDLRSSDGNEQLSEHQNVKTFHSFLNLNGIDCGIKWYHLILVVLLIVSISIYNFYKAKIFLDKHHTS